MLNYIFKNVVCAEGKKCKKVNKKTKIFSLLIFQHIFLKLKLFIFFKTIITI